MTIVSKEKSLLVSIHLVNGTGYDNSAYGIVDGVMYLTSAPLDITYDSNLYKANKIDSFGSFNNAFDALGEGGGYRPFNEFSIKIKDEGIAQILQDQAINFYKGFVQAYVNLDNSIYPMYIGVVDNLSTTGESLTLTCGDVASVKETAKLPKTLLGDWGDDVTSRAPDFSDLDYQVENETYALIFPRTNGSPTEDTLAHYDANPQAYQTLVKTTPTLGGEGWNFDVFCEGKTILDNNTNYPLGSINYISEINGVNLEQLDASGKVIKVWHITGALYNNGDLVNSYLSLTVVEDATALLINSRVRFANCDLKVVYSEATLTDEGNFEGGVNYTPLINDFKGYYETGSVGDPAIVGKEYKLAVADGRTTTKVKVPSSITTTLTCGDFSVTGGAGVVIDDDEQSFISGSETSSTKIGTISKTISDGASQSAFLDIFINADQLRGDDWRLGYCISLVSPSTGDYLYIDADHNMRFKVYTLLDGRGTFTDILLSDQTILLNENKHKIAYTNTEGKRVTLIGASPVLMEKDGGQFVDYVFARTMDDLDTSIKSDIVTGQVRVRIEFTIEATSGSAVTSSDIYLDSCFLFKDELTDVRESVQLDSPIGADWTNDPLNSGTPSGLAYPTTRTEMVRYILDIASSHGISEYENLIYLLPTIDTFKVAWDNYDKLDFSCTQLINDILQGSTFYLVSSMLGKRKMIDLTTLSINPVGVQKAIVGSLDQVKVNGYFSGVDNQYEFEFDGDEVLNAIYTTDGTTGSMDVTATVDLESTTQTALKNKLIQSVAFNQLSKAKKVESRYTNFGSPSEVSAEVGKLFDIWGWPHWKFVLSDDLSNHLTGPLYVGDWLSFRDLRYTNDQIIYGFIQGVKVDVNSGKVSYSCISPVMKPSATILDEQFPASLNLDEIVGGGNISE